MSIELVDMNKQPVEGVAGEEYGNNRLLVKVRVVEHLTQEVGTTIQAVRMYSR